MQSLECIFMCQAELDAPVRAELCCFVLSETHEWWCLLSVLLTQHMLVCCLPSYCLPRALKVQSNKIAERNQKSPIHFPFLPFRKPAFLKHQVLTVYLEWTENLNLGWVMHLLNFTYCSLALECKVLPQFLGRFLWAFTGFESNLVLLLFIIYSH